MIARALHLALGASGEAAAKSHLEGLGWRIDAANWRPAGAACGLELDLVACDGEELVFVEVKTRSGPGNGQQPLHVPVAAAFTPAKQRKVILAARHYLSAHSLWERPCRFDLICLQRAAQGGFTLEHHRNVIDLGHLVGSGDAAWQPW